MILSLYKHRHFILQIMPIKYKHSEKKTYRVKYNFKRLFEKKILSYFNIKDMAQKEETSYHY